MPTDHCHIAHRIHGHGGPDHHASVHLPHPHHYHGLGVPWLKFFFPFFSHFWTITYKIK